MQPPIDEALRGKALHGLDDFKVGHIELFVLESVKVLHGDKDTPYQ
jgi:hypothetical protein